MHSPKRRKYSEGNDASPSAQQDGTSDRTLRPLQQAFRKSQQHLPIWKARTQLVAELKANQTLVLVGETGSGKTTQLPQYVLDAVLTSKGAVACTQPRRLATMSVATRVARERRTPIGREVGYSIRFDDKSSPETRLKYMTDGMLLREALLDPLLKHYKVIILDEAHERTVQTDILFTLVKAAQVKRGKDLKLVVMSATLDAAKFVQYFPGAKAAYLQGRQFPVEIFYTEAPEQDYIDAALMAILQIHRNEAPGDVLVFLTGQDEIENMRQLISDRSRSLEGPGGARSMEVVTVYAAQAPEQQMVVFNPAPYNTRKVVLATNVAETSLTVPGVRYVVDAGMVKSRSFQAKQATESLQIGPVSQAQARQRSGRAGREAPGKAFRLYTEDTFWSLRPTTVPEIQQVRLTSVVLQLKALGVEDPLSFDFMDKPPISSLLRALEQLIALGAIGADGSLSKPLGHSLARLPVEPSMGKVLLTAAQTACVSAALAVLAMDSSDSVFNVPRQKQEEASAAQKPFFHPTGDHLTLASVFFAYKQVKDDRVKWCRQHFLNSRSLKKAVDIYKQLADYLRGMAIEVTDLMEGDEFLGPDEEGEALRRALTSGLFMHAAMRQPDGTYKLVASSQSVTIHPSSVLSGKKPKCIVFGELMRTTRNYARQVTAIDPAWLPELAPSVFISKGAAT